jgi:chemotaxis protein MotB
MRKKKHPEHVNHERWLVSYADFITLLFAFFVVMFAVSQVDSKRVGRFTQAFSKAIGEDIFPDQGHGFMPAADPEAPPSKEADAEPKVPAALVELEKTLKKLADDGDSLKGLQVLERRNELVLRLADNIFFESGDDSLKAPAEAILHTLAPEIARRSVDVRVEGHTDNRPIRTARYRSNWDLSTSRATAVLAKLAAEGVEPPRLSAAGYGEFRPIAPNATEEGRKQNRRVDLVLAIQRPDEAP